MHGKRTLRAGYVLRYKTHAARNVPYRIYDLTLRKRLIRTFQRRIAETLATLAMRLHTVCHGTQQRSTDAVLKRNGNFFLTATVLAELEIAVGHRTISVHIA